MGPLYGVAVDPQGNVVLPDQANQVVLRVDRAGVATVIAGNGFRSYSGDGGPATLAALNFPAYVAIDGNGNIFIADQSNCVIRQISADGMIRTVAGNGKCLYAGDNGPALNASLSDGVTALAVDSKARLYLADRLSNGDYAVRRLNADGTISTVAGGGTDTSYQNVSATKAQFDYLRGIAFDAADNMYLSDTGLNRVFRVSTDGVVTTLAGTGKYGFSGDNGPALQAMLRGPAGVAVDRNGVVYIADASSYVVRAVDAAGMIRTVAGSRKFDSAGPGDNGPATAASLGFPSGLAVSPDGSVVFVDEATSRARRFTPGGSISLVAGNGQFRGFPDGSLGRESFFYRPRMLARDAAGNIFVADSGKHVIYKVTTGNQVYRVAGLGVQGSGRTSDAATDWLLDRPWGVAVSPSGELYIADSGNNVIRKLTADGKLVTVAGIQGVDGSAGENVAATEGQLSFPEQMAFDRAGNLYIADWGAERVRLVTTDGKIRTFAGTGRGGFSGDQGPALQAQLFSPSGVAVDANNNVYIADQDNCRIRKVNSAGVITTIAGTGTGASCITGGDGGPAAKATLFYPVGLALDTAGNLYFSQPSGRVRRIGTDGTMRTFAGTGQSGFAGDGGPATAGVLNVPQGLVVDPTGTLYLSDTLNSRVRAVLPDLPVMQISTSSLAFSAKSGGGAPASQNIGVAATRSGTVWSGLPFTVTTSGGNWLHVNQASGVTPANISISVDPSSLGVGNYTGTVTFSAPGIGSPDRTVNVQLSVASSDPPRLSVTTSSLSFNFQEGSTASSNGQLTLGNQGGGSLSYSISAQTVSGGNWLTVSPASGTLSAANPATVSITANSANLPSGTYTGRLLIVAAMGGTTFTDSRPVTMTVGRAQRIILLSQTGLSFSAVEGGGAPLSQALGVLNIGQGQLQWQAESRVLNGGGNWLKVSGNNGSVARPFLDVSWFDVSIDPSGLTKGDYYGQVRVTGQADNSPQIVTVVLTVLGPGSTPVPEVRPTGLVFTGLQGSNPGSQIVRLSNLTGSVGSYNSGLVTFDGKQWLAHSPTNAALNPNQPVRVVMQPDFSSLDSGVKRGVVTFIFQDGQTRTVDILSVVAPAGTSLNAKPGERAAAGCASSNLSVQFTSLRAGFAAVVGQPTPLEVRVVDDCTAPLTNDGGSVKVRFSNGDADVALAHVGNGTWTGTWNPRNVGQTVSVAAYAVFGKGGLTQSGGGNCGKAGNLSCLAGVVNTGGATPRVEGEDVKHAASYASSVPIAPGGLISIFGTNLADQQGVPTQVPLPTELNSAEVRLGDQPLPLLYTSNGQLNAQVPYGLPVNTDLQLIVKRGPALSTSQSLTVAAAQPGIFTTSQNGSGQGIIFLADGRTYAQPGSPARRGDVVVIYCTGLGAVNPAVKEGAAAPANPLARTVTVPSVSIGGQAAAVEFSGLTPGFAGLYQVNARVPQNITPGNAVPVTITMTGQTSPVVTMAVQ